MCAVVDLGIGIEPIAVGDIAIALLLSSHFLFCCNSSNPTETAIICAHLCDIFPFKAFFLQIQWTYGLDGYPPEYLPFILIHRTNLLEKSNSR